MTSPTHSSAWPPKQESAGMTSKASWDWNCAIQISTLTPEDLWRCNKKDNETLAAYIHHLKTVVKQCAFDNGTAAIHHFVKGLGMHPLLHPKYMRTPKLWPRSSGLLRSSAQHSNQQLHYLLPQSVWCLVTIGVLSVDRQVILAATAMMPSVMTVMNLATLPRTAPSRIPPSGTPHHCRRSCSRHWHTHNWRNKSHSHYGNKDRRHYSSSQSCPHLHCNRNHNLRRHTCCSSSSHCSSLCCPSTDRCSCHDNNRYSHMPSCTQH